MAAAMGFWQPSLPSRFPSCRWPSSVPLIPSKSIVSRKSAAEQVFCRLPTRRFKLQLPPRPPGTGESPSCAANGLAETSPMYGSPLKSPTRPTSHTTVDRNADFGSGWFWGPRHLFTSSSPKERLHQRKPNCRRNIHALVKAKPQLRPHASRLGRPTTKIGLMVAYGPMTAAISCRTSTAWWLMGGPVSLPAVGDWNHGCFLLLRESSGTSISLRKTPPPPPPRWPLGQPAAEV